MSQSLTVSVAVGNFAQEVGTIRLESSASTGEINLELLFLLIPAFAMFILVVLACGILVGCAIIKMKRIRYTMITLTIRILDSYATNINYYAE